MPVAESDGAQPGAARPPSVVSGPPLADEPGLGALTLPGFLREVTAAYGEREALVMHTGEGVTRWTYAELWERAIEVAQALRACGVGKDSRVGVLMTNRPEWIAAAFGASLTGAVVVTLSTFSTPSELDHLLRVSGVSVLLFERSVLKTDFAAVLTELEPEIGKAAPGALQSARFPFLRRLVSVGDAAPGPGTDTWDGFLARGLDQPRELVEATAASVRPSDTAVLFFSSGSTSRPKGILSAHRGVAVQLWRCSAHVRIPSRGRGPLLDGQRLLLVRQLRHGARRDLLQRRRHRAAADLRPRGSTGAHAGGAGELPVRLAAPVGAARRGAQLEQRGSEQHAVRGPQQPHRAPSHGVGEVVRAEPRLRQHGDLHARDLLPGQHAARGARRQQRRGAAGRDGQDRRPAHGRRRPARRARRDLRQGPHADAGLPRHAAGRDARRGGLPPYRRRRSSRRHRPASSGRAGSPTSSRPAARTSRRWRWTRRSPPAPASR